MDLTAESWLNGCTYCPQRDTIWYYSNKVYKSGKVCILSVDVDTRNCTANSYQTRILRISDPQFRPICLINAAINNDGIGYIVTHTGEVWVSRDTTRYPTWADIYVESAGTGARICVVYLAKE